MSTSVLTVFHDIDVKLLKGCWTYMNSHDSTSVHLGKCKVMHMGFNNPGVDYLMDAYRVGQPGWIEVGLEAQRISNP